MNSPISYGRVQPLASGVGLVHLFGSIGAIGAGNMPTEYPEFTQRNTLRNASDGCSRTWVVTLTGREIQRLSAEEPIEPLMLPAFDNPPAGALSVPRTQMKFAITADLGFAGLRRFFADAGQSFEIEASKVCIDWFAPASFVPVLDNMTDPPSATGFVLDSMIGCEAAIVENAIGIPELTFTTHLFVAAAGTGNIIVPPYATEVVIYQSPAGAAATQWVQAYGVAPVGPADIGVIPFIAGARKTEQEILLPDTTHLRTDIDAVNNRFFTLRWTIRP